MSDQTTITADVQDADVADTTDDVVQPADVEDVPDDMATPEAEQRSQEVAEVLVRMDLTLSADMDPNALNPAQQSALKSIVNFDLKEPNAWGHVIAFMHMCVKRGLDPFAREAYLIARGKIADKPQYSTRKYTMQTGIDGYLVLAARTGKFIRVKDRLWTGADDDNASWWIDAEGVRRRVWQDYWPASKGFPGAAKVVIEHLDDHGRTTTTEYVADWDMYCPMYDEYRGSGSNRAKTGARTPGEMWVKGGPMMLAKCAIAAGLRLAIPGGLNGLYIHEEMHRADQIEQDRQRSAATNRIIDHVASQVAKPVPDAAADPEQEPGEAPAGPLLPLNEPQEAPVEPDDGTVDADVVADEDDVAGWTPEQELALIRAEAEWQAQTLGKSLADLVQRPIAAEGVDGPGALSLEGLAAAVFGNRARVTNALRRDGRDAEADVYGSWDEQVGTMDVLLGRA